MRGNAPPPTTGKLSARQRGPPARHHSLWVAQSIELDQARYILSLQSDHGLRPVKLTTPLRFTT